MGKINNFGLLKALNILMVPDVIPKWTWPGHANVIEVVYNKMPDEIKGNLDLNKMKDGSNDPDEKFKDTALHHYPKSYDKAKKWLDDGKTNYTSKNYEQASYCFGVASHYIADTFAAPHCVSKEPSNLHHKFEVENDDYTPTAEYKSGDMDTLMRNGIAQGEKDWKDWLETKDTSIPHSEADMGASVAYSVIKDMLG